MKSSDSAEGDDLVPLSAINAYLYCDRRAALRHLDALYVHNEHTRQGDIGHRRADKMGVERRPGVRTERGLWIVSHRLRLYGRADLVEFPKPSKRTGSRHAQGAIPVPYPVEYKRGKLKRWENDEMQLCAQAFCLEEMLGVTIPTGAIYHARSRKRREVVFDALLREATEAAVAGLHALLASGKVPPAVLKPRCRGCSLRGHCLPEAFAHPRRTEMLTRDLFKANYSDPES